jgi:hypothetical protein
LGRVKYKKFAPVCAEKKIEFEKKVEEDSKK